MTPNESFQPIGPTPGAGVTAPRSASTVLWVGGLAFGLLLLPFVPLMLSGLEYLAFGTSHVEDFFRHIGLHGALSKLYRFVLDPFM